MRLVPGETNRTWA